MSKSVVVQRAERELVRLCHRRIDGPAVSRDLLRALRQVMPVDAAFLATADPETLLFTGAWPEHPLDTVTEQFLGNEFGSPDVNRFAALATALRHVGSLDEATRGDRWASPRYRDILRPLGLGDELRAALVANGWCWGYLCLHRADGRTGFSATEAATVARLGPHLAHAFRASMRPMGWSQTGLPPGVVVLTDDLTIVGVTPEAAHLLSLIEPDNTRTFGVPTAVVGVARALVAVERCTAPVSVLPTARVGTRAGGWLGLHASRLTGRPGEGRIAVVVEPVQARAVVPMLLSAHGLSPREADVTRLVLRGVPTRAIADELHITANTVQDHLKAVFDKVGVRSRRDLVGRLLGPPNS